MKYTQKLLRKHVQFIKGLIRNVIRKKSCAWHCKDNNNADGNFRDASTRTSFRGWQTLQVRLRTSSTLSIFSPASSLEQCHLAIIIFSCGISIALSVAQSHALYRSLSMERRAVLSIATQWPSPLEVQALLHLKLRAFPTDMSKCTTRSIERVSNVRAGYARMLI